MGGISDAVTASMLQPCKLPRIGPIAASRHNAFTSAPEKPSVCKHHTTPKSAARTIGGLQRHASTASPLVTFTTVSTSASLISAGLSLSRCLMRCRRALAFGNGMYLNPRTHTHTHTHAHTRTHTHHQSHTARHMRAVTACHVQTLHESTPSGFIELLWSVGCANHEDLRFR